MAAGGSSRRPILTARLLRLAGDHPDPPEGASAVFREKCQGKILTTAGALKRDPDTGAIALRTSAGASGHHAWLIATVNRGAHVTEYERVADWDDITVPSETSGDRAEAATGRGHGFAAKAP